MSATGRSCYRLPDATVASCVAMLKEERTIRAIASELGISGASVSDIKRKHVMGIDRTHGRKLAELPEEAHCPRCELRGDHVCLPEDGAVAYLGRRGEPAFAGR